MAADAAVPPVCLGSAEGAALASAWGVKDFTGGRSTQFQLSLQKLGEALIALQQCGDDEIDTAVLSAYYTPLKRFVADKMMRAWASDEASIVSVVPTSNIDGRRRSVHSPPPRVRSSQRKVGTKCHCGKILPLDYVAMYHDGRINDLELIDFMPYLIAYGLEEEARGLPRLRAAELVVRHLMEEETAKRAKQADDTDVGDDTMMGSDYCSETSCTTLSFELIEESEDSGSLEYLEEQVSPEEIARRRASRDALRLARQLQRRQGKDDKKAGRRFEAKLIRRVDPAAAAAAREARAARRQRMVNGERPSTGAKTTPTKTPRQRAATQPSSSTPKNVGLGPKTGSMRKPVAAALGSSPRVLSSSGLTSPSVGGSTPGDAPLSRRLPNGDRASDRGSGGASSAIQAGLGAPASSSGRASPASQQTGSPLDSPRTGDEGAAGFRAISERNGSGSLGARGKGVPSAGSTSTMRRAQSDLRAAPGELKPAPGSFRSSGRQRAPTTPKK
eukprot:TRINITY_DN11053_c0_g1_i1.p1 TRINITY_DN11053_c0_g1~~TRINITY_DN11053_c0_g1_i1.p1  ORF type:complete len:502 (+),score=128.41 TRINITY_DN11053_c0_g1_i1:75-1580(+)